MIGATWCEVSRGLRLISSREGPARRSVIVRLCLIQFEVLYEIVPLCSPKSRACVISDCMMESHMHTNHEYKVSDEETSHSAVNLYDTVVDHGRDSTSDRMPVVCPRM